MNTNQKVKGFLGKYFDVQSISEDDDIFEKGLVNSLFAMQLVDFVENEFDISISNNELDISNFRCITAIVSLINSKLCE